MADKKVAPKTHPDHPEFVRPGAEQTPKTITLKRKNQPAHTSLQTVTVRPDDKVREILAKTLFPKAALVSPETGYKIDPSDFLYRHVKHGGTVEVEE